MAIFVLTNAYVMVNAVDLSDHVRSVKLEYEADLQESSAMGTGTRTRIAGLKDWSIEVEFNNDFASGSVDATLFPLIGAAPFAIHVKPVNTTISATNPDYTGNVVLETHQPIGNEVGEIATTEAKFVASGALDRDVSP